MPDPVAFKLQPYDTRAHVAFRVYAGPDTDHLALCGELRMRPEEFAALQLALAPQPAAQDHEPTDAQILAALSVLGWPDDRTTSAHPGVTEAGYYWATAAQIVAASAATIAPPPGWDLDAVHHLMQRVQAPTAIRGYPQDRTGDGVPETEQAAAALPVIELRRPHDERIDLYVNGKQVASADHDEHGWAGMDAFTRSATAIVKAFGGEITEGELLDETCGDCMSGKCHGGEDGDCGCARHDASVEAGQ